MTIHTLELDSIAVSLDASVGHIADLTIRDGQRLLSPLHRAPWVDDPDADFPTATAPNVMRLSGDFFCAPFGRNDVEAAPSHGWPANSEWDHVETLRRDDRATMFFQLQRKVMGARVEKRLTLIAGHPFLYQEHRFCGGSGAVSAAHHVMVHMQQGGELAVSPKRLAVTPPETLEPDPSRGRSLLAYPAQSRDLRRFPLAGGGAVDLTRYPLGERHEDFVTLVEQAERTLGWSLVSRNAEQDRIIVLKRPDTLPVTMLWMSNGGRDYAPWSGRHAGVLGLEDARASPLGHAGSITANDFTRTGVPTAFVLDAAAELTIRHIIGACAAGPDEGGILNVEVGREGLVLHFDSGNARELAYDPGFLAK